MGILAEGSEIRRLLNMRGNKRLGIKNNLTAEILESCKSLESQGIMRLKFLESGQMETDNGSWINYNILLETLKLEENNLEYLGTMIGTVGNFIKGLRSVKGIDRSGIQEVECGLPKYYYFLIFIHSDGTEKEED